MVYNRNPIKMDASGVPLFLETPICCFGLDLFFVGDSLRIGMPWN